MARSTLSLWARGGMWRAKGSFSSSSSFAGFVTNRGGALGEQGASVEVSNCHTLFLRLWACTLHALRGDCLKAAMRTPERKGPRPSAGRGHGEHSYMLLELGPIRGLRIIFFYVSLYALPELSANFRHAQHLVQFLLRRVVLVEVRADFS